MEYDFFQLKCGIRFSQTVMQKVFNCHNLVLQKYNNTVNFSSHFRIVQKKLVGHSSHKIFACFSKINLLSILSSISRSCFCWSIPWTLRGSEVPVPCYNNSTGLPFFIWGPNAWHHWMVAFKAVFATSKKLITTPALHRGSVALFQPNACKSLTYEPA